MNEMPPDITPQNLIHSHGLLFPNDTDVLIPRTRQALRQNTYELREFQAVQALVNSDDIVLEIGAGIGFMSTVVAKICKAKSVEAYEANPGLIPYIHKTHQINEVTNVTVHNAVLAENQGEPVDFHVRRNLLASSLDPMQGDSDGGVLSVEKVPVHNINTVLKTLKPTVLICDIEGAEADLLPVADLTGIRCAIVELHPQWIGQKGVQAVFDTMHRAGLTYFPKRSNKKVVTFRADW